MKRIKMIWGSFLCVMVLLFSACSVDSITSQSGALPVPDNYSQTGILQLAAGKTPKPKKKAIPKLKKKTKPKPVRTPSPAVATLTVQLPGQLPGQETIPLPPKGSYADMTNLRDVMMGALNDARVEKGSPAGRLKDTFNNVAQDRARQMAAAGKYWHIGSGYFEAVGSMLEDFGAYNRGFNAITHVSQMGNADLLDFGIGVAMASDGEIYYSIIAQYAGVYD